MQDLLNGGQTPILVVSNLLLIVLLYLYLKPVLLDTSANDRKVKLTYILMFVFCLFSFWGKDWFGYLSYFERVKAGLGEYVHMEEFYIWLMEVLPSYLIFRSVVWGAALLLLNITINNFNINKGLFFFFFCSISLIWFSYARVTLAMSVMFCGVSYISKGIMANKGVFYKILGVSLIAGSFFLHKSAAIGIVAIGLAILLNQIGKSISLKLLMLAFPIIVIAIKRVFAVYFNELANDESSILNEYAVSGSSTISGDATVHGIGIMIQHLFEWLPSYIIVYITYKLLSARNSLPSNITLLMLTLCCTVFVSSIFAFDLGMNTQILQIRMMRYTQIPLCLCLAFLYENGIYPKLVKNTYTFGIAGCAYSFLYLIYNLTVG